MFQVDDVIIYGSQGVCRITGIEEKRISGAKKTYFVLEPVQAGGATVFAPVDNEQVRKKMRRLLTKNEIHDLIDSVSEGDAAWVENENERKDCYRKILAEGDRGSLIHMIKAIYLHKKAREAEGKRLHMTDEHFFKDAERILYNEFQYVLELESREDLMQYIISRIESRE